MFAIVFATPLGAQENSITVKFENLELLEKGWKDKLFYFKINEVILSPDTIIHEVAINLEGLDHFYFSFDSTFNNAQPIFTKFKDGYGYTIRINSCSQYELMADYAPKLGQVRFKVINSDSLYSGGLCASDSLEKDKLSDYYEPCQSVMCRFAPVEISFSRKQEPVDLVLFHFLHGEKLTAILDASNNEVQLVIDDSEELRKQAPRIYHRVGSRAPFKPNGYNKFYNYNDDVWLDGDFRNGRLWNGKLYEYDRNEHLLRIKIFKDGFYHSEEQL